MKRLFYSLLTAGLFVANVHAASDMKLLWEVTGLNNPESVVYHPKSDTLIVSNVNGSAVEKDGNGYLSKVSLDGKLLEKNWVTGLNAPKGLAIHKDTLYIADIDTLVAVDIPSGKIGRSYRADGAEFLNDVAATEQGDVFVSDMFLDRIYRLHGGQFSIWLESPLLENPNGLHVEGNSLILGAWGVMKEGGFATEVPGRLKRISLSDKFIADLGGTPIGNMDGVERAGSDGYYATDWMAGKLFKVNKKGEAKLVLQLKQGAADLEVLSEKGLMFLPMMMDNKLLAYKIN